MLRCQQVDILDYELALFSSTVFFKEDLFHIPRGFIPSSKKIYYYLQGGFSKKEVFFFGEVNSFHQTILCM